MAIAYFCDYCGAENVPGETLCHACQHPLAQLSSLEERGTLLNERYAIISEIGAGGFGAVYLARDTHISNQLVAIKQINLKGLSAQEIIEATDAFNREAEILTTLSHSLLPSIFDRFNDPEHWYLVMTYIDGSTLDEYLQQHRVKSLPAVAGLPLGEILTIALQLCDALHYLHSQQPAVIFRDLKPGNIMRTRKGRLYLIDFGIARRFKPGQAKDTIPFGSPGFAAPEQYGRAQTTPQADVYSLGALLYCLLTGDDPSEHPFDFPPLHQYGIDGIRELNALIQRMIALDPTKRPADIQEVQAELQRIQHLNTKANQQNHIWTPPQGQTPSADGNGQQHIFLNPSTSTPQQKNKTTRRAVITAALVLGVAAAAGGIAALINQPQPSVQSQPISQGDLGDQQTADAQNTDATAVNQTPAVPLNGPTFWSPDMSYAAVVHTGQQQIDLYKVQGQKLINTIKVPLNFTNPTISLSPDGNKMLIQDSGVAYIWNATNNQMLSVTEDGNPTFTVSWSPDSQICALSYLYPEGALYIDLIDSNNGGHLFSNYSPNTDYTAYDTVSNVAWSPDSKYFAFPDAAGWPEGQSWTASTWDRKTHQLSHAIIGWEPPGAISGPSTIASIAWSPGGQKLATIVEGVIFISQLNNQSGSSTSMLANTDIDTNAPVNGFIWSPNEHYLAILTQQELSVYNTSSGQQVSLNGNGYPPQTNNVVAFTWAADSQSVTVADSNNNLWQWSIEQS